MKHTTLVLIRREGEILLCMKKRWFGAGLYNGAGGKIQDLESVRAAAIRELAEETGLILSEESLREHGMIHFIFLHESQWEQDMTIFVADMPLGQVAIETEEMRPQWFPLAAIPYESMWKDDIYWLPKVLAGESIRAKCVLNEKGEVVEWEESEKQKSVETK